ncbi:uncharacterized membrane protein YjgN (DUF898 family) [Hydrogenophaga palleronii]|uniref:Uncharacterized membrane protein YjgN (DUF898 family) n=1 Tax=Hydrogenophaga palleronii TaxID=65655 RepID=A0ABU1WUY2_9BURK|nr:YjgN family protein [Hydrogenophaga palleronii]MDR7152984.1 uncharacterized membrane protein YjgN (DUF898 family) [Hydrogenophaga palleronii]
MEPQGEFAPTQTLPDEGDPKGLSNRTLDVRFTGSGSEYFRIWIVNLLLTLVTLTLYWPFARARRMAYFQNNTLVGGDPLGFHADPWKMFRGYLVMLVLGVGYWAISNFVPSLSWVPFLVLMALWPALWRASLQFRLRNTSWRGVRFAFEGDLKSAYMAMLPFFVPGLVFVLMLPAVETDEELVSELAQGAAAMMGVVTLAFLVLLPWLWARVKRYQHGGYAFAQERTSLKVGAGRFYLLFLKLVGLTLLVVFGSLAVLVAVLSVTVGVGAVYSAMGGGGAGAGTAAIFLMIIGFVAVFYLVVPLVLGPFAASRMQNLLWDNTRSEQVTFQSQLRFRSLFRVTLVNLLLLVLTLGLFWPFAKVRTARVKLEAMAVEVDGDVDQWVAKAQQRNKGVLGDAAGDFFGMDMGL